MNTCTLYDKLDSLSSEISSQILNINRGDRETTQKEMDDLKTLSSEKRFSELVYGILLFRKYSDIVNETIDEKLPSTETVEPPTPFLSNNEEDQLIGWNAFKANIFWYRMTASFFSFVSSLLMVTVPFIFQTQYSDSSKMLVSIGY